MLPGSTFWMLLPLILGGRDVQRLDLGDAINPPERCVARAAGFRQAQAEHERAYCTALARGYGALNSDPKAARQFAEAAFAEHPDVAARLLVARALVALGEFSPAWSRFEGILATVQLGALAPAALQDVGVAAALSGHDAVALDAYRRLLPRLSLLSAGRRARAPLEAALAALRVSSDFIPEARTAARRVLADRSGRAPHALARAVLRVADELAALNGQEVAPSAPNEAWPDAAVLQVNRPLLPPGEAQLLDLMLQSGPLTDEAAAVWKGLAAHANPQWRALAERRLQTATE